MKKLAVIRNENISCPFGLSPIPKVCAKVGDAILSMQALELLDDIDKEAALTKNKIIYHTQKADQRCPFADQIIYKFNAVNCSYGDVGAGERSSQLPASPFYPSINYGNGYAPGRTDQRGQTFYDPRDVMYGQEKGIDTPYGLFSIFSSCINEVNLIKLASKPTNKTPNIQEKLALLKDKYFEMLKLLFPAAKIAKLSDEQLNKMITIIGEWT